MPKTEEEIKDLEEIKSVFSEILYDYFLIDLKNMPIKDAKEELINQLDDMVDRLDTKRR